MTLMMVAPMTILMICSMRSMFPSQRTNLLLALGAMLIFSGSFLGMRTQAGVGNADFLRAMIPHYSGAILMCEQASISDPRIIDLCRGIVATQQEEISRMEEILDTL